MGERETEGDLDYWRRMAIKARQERDDLAVELAQCAPAPAEAVALMQVRINLLCPNGHTRTVTTSCACHPAPARGEAVTEEMVLAGALAYFTATCKEYGISGDWNRVSQKERDRYLADTRIVLSAALARPDRERDK